MSSSDISWGDRMMMTTCDVLSSVPSVLSFLCFTRNEKTYRTLSTTEGEMNFFFWGRKRNKWQERNVTILISRVWQTETPKGKKRCEKRSHLMIRSKHHQVWYRDDESVEYDEKPRVCSSHDVWSFSSSHPLMSVCVTKVRNIYHLMLLFIWV